MKPKYRLKKWVVSSIYVFAISLTLISFVLLNKVLTRSIYAEETLSYVYGGIFEDIKPVVNYKNKEIVKPFVEDNVEIAKSYYDMNDTEEGQENSLILYQKTYMPNTGVLYKSEEEFNIVSVLDGTVVDIVPDEIIGNIVTIKHSNNVTTIYQSLNEVNVLTGDLIKQGDVIGTSGSNKIDSSSDYMLLFEVIVDGEYINPEDFFKMNPEEFN